MADPQAWHRQAPELARRRLRSQGIASAPFTGVAKWSVGQRATGVSDATLDAALADAVDRHARFVGLPATLVPGR